MDIPDQILVFVSSFLTFGETHIICQQFNRVWRPNKQVLWNGNENFRQVAQKWADKNGLQTLTTAMGSLMTESNPSYGKKGVGKKRTNYIKGACALFAWYISMGDKIVVLALPPDENGDRFNPSPYTNFRGIEEPIVKGQLGNSAVGEMLIVHPTVPQAEEFFYALWPIDGQKAMKAILDSQGRGRWNWRVPNPSEKARACLDEIRLQVSSSMGNFASSGVATDLKQEGKGSNRQGAANVTPPRPTNTQQPLQQGVTTTIIERPSNQVDNPTLSKGDIVVLLGKKERLERGCVALRLVLAADEQELDRARSKLDRLLELVSSLKKQKAQEKKAAVKSSDQGSSKVSVKTEPQREKPHTKECSGSCQPAPSASATLSKATTSAGNAQTKTRKKKKKNGAEKQRQKQEGK